MKKFRRIAWGALLSGVLAFLIVPLVVPMSTSGFVTEREAAGEGATFVTVGDLEVHYELAPYRGAEVNRRCWCSSTALALVPTPGAKSWMT